MKFHISSAKLTSSPSQTGWAQVHDFAPKEEEKLTNRGRLFAVISTQKKETSEGKKQEIDSVAAGRELLARLHEEYFGKVDISAFNGLKRALEKIIEEFSEELGQIEISAAALVGETVYSAAVGGAEASIFREGALATILKSKGNEVVVASGHPKEGDLFVLSSSSVVRTVGPGRLKAALESGGAKEVVESLAPTIHASKDSGDLGLVVIGFEKEEVPVSVATLGEEERPDKKEERLSSSKVFLTQRLGAFGQGLSRLRGKLPKRKLYIKKGQIDIEDSQKRKTAVSVGLVLIIILIVSIGFGIRQKGIIGIRSQYEPALFEAQHELEEAKSLFSLNPERARELFSNSRLTTQKLKEEGIKDERLDTLIAEINQSGEAILGEYQTESSLFLDLSILADGLTADGLAAGVDKMFVLDKTGKRVVKIAVDTKKTEVIAGPTQINDPLSIAAYEDRVYVEEDGGIFQVGSSREEAVEDEWGGEVLIYAYAGNLYVLEKEDSRVWRYPGVESGFASAQSWLAPGIEPDLSKVMSWTIDGSVWILTSSGKIEKYSLGSPATLGLAVSPALENPTAIYTNEEVEGVYVLEPALSRVVVFDKEGNYLAQYSSEGLSEAKNLAVSEKEGLIIFLKGERLEAIEIKHL